MSVFFSCLRECHIFSIRIFCLSPIYIFWLDTFQPMNVIHVACFVLLKWNKMLKIDSTTLQVSGVYNTLWNLSAFPFLFCHCVVSKLLNLKLVIGSISVYAFDYNMQVELQTIGFYGCFCWYIFITTIIIRSDRLQTLLIFIKFSFNFIFHFVFVHLILLF